MYRIININLLDYLSLILVISFFIFHNIYIVIVGLCLAIYLVNKNYIEILIDSIQKILIMKDDKKIRNVSKTSIIKNEGIKEDYKFSLVETIEEYGFIPSLEKEDDSKVA